MTPVPSITRPWCHRWRNNNRLNYPALHTWLNSTHCSPTNLEAGSPDSSPGWAQVVALACPLLLCQRCWAKGCQWVGVVGRSLHSGLKPQFLKKAVRNQELKISISSRHCRTFHLASPKPPAPSQGNAELFKQDVAVILRGTEGDCPRNSYGRAVSKICKAVALLR